MSAEIPVEFQQVCFVVIQRTFINTVFKILDNRFLPIVLSRYSGSGSLIGICLQAY